MKMNSFNPAPAKLTGATERVLPPTPVKLTGRETHFIKVNKTALSSRNYAYVMNERETRASVEWVRLFAIKLFLFFVQYSLASGANEGG